MEKSAAPVASGLATADLASCAFMGTTVREGAGQGVVVATAGNTVFGKIALGASAFLKFLPLLPSQVLLNNLLYDTGELTIPTDEVDEEMLERPSRWDIGFIERFMLVFGPTSSLFDFVTFALMLGVFHAVAAHLLLPIWSLCAGWGTCYAVR